MLRGGVSGKQTQKNCMQEVYRDMILASTPVEKGKPDPGRG